MFYFRNILFFLIPGGNYIKVWDLLSGAGRLFTQFSYHQKTITTICFDGNYKRLLSGGLDRFTANCLLVKLVNCSHKIISFKVVLQTKIFVVADRFFVH